MLDKPGMRSRWGEAHEAAPGDTQRGHRGSSGADANRHADLQLLGTDAPPGPLSPAACGVLREGGRRGTGREPAARRHQTRESGQPGGNFRCRANWGGMRRLFRVEDSRRRAGRQLPTQRSVTGTDGYGQWRGCMFATRVLMRACARSDLCLSTAVAYRPCEKSCVYIAPRTPAPEHSLTRGSRRAFNPDLGHPDLSQPGARDDQGHRQARPHTCSTFLRGLRERREPSSRETSMYTLESCTFFVSQ
jgi:hypothetical protein